MKRTHLTMDEMDSFRRGTLTADQLESVSEHLRECDECGAAADGAARALLIDLANEEHPEVDELFAYVDGTLSRERRQEIAQHLLTCVQCREDVGDAEGARTSRPQRSGVSPDRRFVDGQDARRLRARMPALLVAAAIAIVVALLWFTQRVPLPVNAPPRIVRVTPPPPKKSEWEPLIAEARQARAVPMPAIIRELRGQSESFRGNHEGHKNLQLSPAGTVVFSQRPEFTWRAKQGEKYILSIVCDDKLTTKSEPVSGGRWTPDRPLPRGLVCMWQLERLSDHEILPAPPAPQPAFKVLDEAAANEIERAEAQQPRDELAVGLLYARAGVQKDAREHLQQYVETHPTDTVAPSILQSIERW